MGMMSQYSQRHRMEMVRCFEDEAGVRARDVIPASVLMLVGEGHFLTLPTGEMTDDGFTRGRRPRTGWGIKGDRRFPA